MKRIVDIDELCQAIAIRLSLGSPEYVMEIANQVLPAKQQVTYEGNNLFAIEEA
jgi:hypothetical protein